MQGSRLYRTGDMGRVLPSTGELEIIGRCDFMVKIRGEIPPSAASIQPHHSTMLSRSALVSTYTACAGLVTYPTGAYGMYPQGIRSFSGLLKRR